MEIKEQINRIYNKYEVFIVPVLKFLLALVSLLVINGQLGYMRRIDSTGIVLIVALLCSFLPGGFILVFAALFVLLHFYALAIEVALVGLCVFLVIALLFFRFSPKDSLVVLITPICFFLKIPYVMPICMGLVGTPASAVSVGCGVIVYYLVSFVSGNMTAISALDEAENTARLRMVIDALIDNRAMLVILAAFVVTTIVVYLIRRLSVDYSWTIAIVAGAMLDAVIVLIGDLVYDTNVSVFGVLLGSLVAALIAKAVQFFVFSVDYNRTEKVQFEDDEYYYYVKAVPKMTVAAPEKTVKKINSQMSGSRRPASAAGGKAVAGRMPRPVAGGRTVTVERTGSSSRNINYNRAQSGRTVTGSRPQPVRDINDTAEEIFDDYEEL